MRISSLLVFALAGLFALPADACMINEKRADKLLSLYKKDEKALWQAAKPDDTDPNNLAWNCDMANIAKGNEKWLEVAVLLRSYANESAAKSLDIAAGEALLKNPKAVLELSERGFTPENICIVPYTDPHPDLVKEYVANVKSILETEVKDKELETAKNQCIFYLDKALKASQAAKQAPAPFPSSSPKQ